MAIVYSKVDQGRTITVCDSVPVHTGTNGVIVLKHIQEMKCLLYVRVLNGQSKI